MRARAVCVGICVCACAVCVGICARAREGICVDACAMCVGICVCAVCLVHGCELCGCMMQRQQQDIGHLLLSLFTLLQ